MNTPAANRQMVAAGEKCSDYRKTTAAKRPTRKGGRKRKGRQ